MIFCVHVIFKHIASVRWGILMQVDAHQYMCSQIFTARKVIFSEACVKNSVHKGGGVCLSACWDPSGADPPDQAPTLTTDTPGLDTPPGCGPPPWPRHPLGADTPREQTPPEAVHAGRYGQRAGGMHPTGMQSCGKYFCAT